MIEGGEGRFWKREDDVEAWQGIYRSLDWRERKPCPFTKSGAWPVKLPNGVSIFISSRTTWHWRNVLHKLIDLIPKYEVYTIDTFVMVIDEDNHRRAFYSIAYGHDWCEIPINAA